MLKLLTNEAPVSLVAGDVLRFLGALNLGCVVVALAGAFQTTAVARATISQKPARMRSSQFINEIVVRKGRCPPTEKLVLTPPRTGLSYSRFSAASTPTWRAPGWACTWLIGCCAPTAATSKWTARQGLAPCFVRTWGRLRSHRFFYSWGPANEGRSARPRAKNLIADARTRPRPRPRKKPPRAGPRPPLAVPAGRPGSASRR